MFTVLPLIGTAVAIQPLLGFNYGAGLIPRVRETVRFGILMATVIGTCMWIMIMLFSGDIVSFFGIRADGLRDFTAFALKVQLLVLPVVGFQIVVGNYFQATGQPMKSIILSLTRQVLFLIPLYIVLPIVLPILVPALIFPYFLEKRSIIRLLYDVFICFRTIPSVSVSNCYTSFHACSSVIPCIRN